jgi:hypothetical protein
MLPGKVSADKVPKQKPQRSLYKIQINTHRYFNNLYKMFWITGKTKVVFSIWCLWYTHHLHLQSTCVSNRQVFISGGNDTCVSVSACVHAHVHVCNTENENCMYCVCTSCTDVRTPEVLPQN